MPELKFYEPSTPCWIDLASPDVEKSVAFYSDLFGWKADVGGPEVGGYVMFTKDGLPVAGGMALQNEVQPPVWTSYVSVESAEETMKKVTEAGGTPFFDVMDVMTLGRMSVFADTTGGAIGIWEPKDFHGAGLANEPGSLVWNELQTRDVEAAKTFYHEVFGWGANTSVGEAMTYTEWKLGDKSIGGLMEMPPMVPAEVPPYWLVYFAVEDCDAAVAKTAELGGSTIMPPMDIEPGRFSVLTDSNGSVFAVIQMKAMA